MVGHAGSPTRIVHIAMTLTRSKVKVKVMGLLKFRKLPFLHGAQKRWLIMIVRDLV